MENELEMDCLKEELKRERTNVFIGQWCLTVDHRKWSDNTPPLTVAVWSITSVVTVIQAAAHPWMATLDVKDMFFYGSLREEDKPQLLSLERGCNTPSTNSCKGINAPPVLLTVLWPSSYIFWRCQQVSTYISI